MVIAKYICIGIYHMSNKGMKTTVVYTRKGMGWTMGEWRYR